MPELSIIIPTLNERQNIEPLLHALEAVLGTIDYEVVFVDDDSDDGTAELTRALAQKDRRVRVIHRIARRGLASATIEGMMATSSPAIAVLDGDMQHDETLLPSMLHTLNAGNLDLVVGTRHAGGGSMGQFSADRVRLSGAGKALSRLVSQTALSDPMSGFFVVSRSFLNEVVRSLTMRGYKILLDLVASSPRPVNFAEAGYTFRERRTGQSKLDLIVAVQYLELIADKLTCGLFPVSYVTFTFVGSLGLLAHLGTVVALLSMGLSFQSAQFESSLAVIALNFLLNNYFTFRLNRLKRRASLLMGAGAFFAACGIGLWFNLHIAQFLQTHGLEWYGASAVGLGVGSIWNYWVSSVFIWQIRRQAKRQRSHRHVRAVYSNRQT